LGRLIKNPYTGSSKANTALTGTTVGGVKVLGHVNLLQKLRMQKIRGAIIAIGDNRVRASYARLVMDAKLELINAIHPSATVSPSAVLGKNIVVAARATICTEAKIGDSVIANTGCVIDHECEVGESSHICPGALLAGRVRVGAGAFIGIGATILPCLSVGSHAIIGAGATVIRDVADGATVVGTPARVIKTAA
jgi:UDP-perosamine 4-acetyltransferase